MIISIIGNIILIIIIYFWSNQRGKKARSIIKKWADNNNYELLIVEYKLFYDMFKMSKAQMNYYVKVKIDKNKEKSFILIIGDYWLGLLFNEDIKIDVYFHQ